MAKDLLKKIVVGRLIVGAGLGLSSCKKYKIDGHRVDYNILTNNVIEYPENNKIKYFVSSDDISRMTSVKINGRSYKTGIVFNEAEKKFDYLKKQMVVIDEAKDKEKKENEIAKRKGYLEKDLEVLKGNK